MRKQSCIIITSTGTVNRSGLVLVLVHGVGADSMLAKVVRLIEDAQVAKAPIQAFPIVFYTLNPIL